MCLTRRAVTEWHTSAPSVCWVRWDGWGGSLGRMVETELVVVGVATLVRGSRQIARRFHPGLSTLPPLDCKGPPSCCPTDATAAPVRACGLSDDCRHLLAVLGKGFIFRFEYLGPLAPQHDASVGGSHEQEGKENTNTEQQ